jgi:inhibitor of the pro-sigma K processing machinery
MNQMTLSFPAGQQDTLFMLAVIAIGILILCVVAKIIAVPLEIIKKLVMNSVLGAIMLYGIDFVGAGVPIDFVNALIAGVFGVPGVIVLFLLYYFHFL